MFDLAYIESITGTEKVDIPNQALPEKREVTYMSNLKRRICDVPFYKEMNIQSGVQKNEKAQKLLYLKVEDPWLPQGAKIKWCFRNHSFSGEVKFTKPKGAIVFGCDKECYIISDNE
jgi:hypothetical protein